MKSSSTIIKRKPLVGLGTSLILLLVSITSGTMALPLHLQASTTKQMISHRGPADCSSDRMINCQSSLNWAGVSAVSHNYTEVYGHWTLPCNDWSPAYWSGNVLPSPNAPNSSSSYFSTWIGLGKSEYYPASSPLVQAGIDSEIMQDGTTKYTAWVEAYVNDQPGGDHQHDVTNYLSLHCHDDVWVYISSQPGVLGSDYYAIGDDTSGTYYWTHSDSEETKYPVIGGYSSADWIVERIGGRPLYNFGQVYFSWAEAVATDVHVGWRATGYWPWVTHTMCTPDNMRKASCANTGTLAHVIAETLDLPSYGSRDAFDVEWFGSGTNVPPPPSTYHGG